jgi:peptide/nickel transport system substrate-binding protein
MGALLKGEAPMRFITGLAFAACLVACSGHSALAAIGDSASQPLVIAFNGGAVTLDPIMRAESTTTAWQQHIFDTITIEGTHGELEPHIALTWRSVDPTTWRLTLRQGVKFQDGTPMTAEDVGESILDTARNPKSQFRELANSVSGYKVISPDTIEVTFSRPDPVFPVHLEGIPVMPEALIKKEGREAFANHPIGTGPYRFVSWLADDHLDLAAWDGFWGDKPAFRYVHLDSIPNGATRLASLLSGQIQVAEKIDPSDFQRVKNSGKAYISLTPGQRTIYLAMDYWRVTGSPGMPAGQKNPFMDPRVREAVRLAINVPAIKAKIFNGAAEIAAQFTPHGVEGFDPSLKAPAYNVAGAKKLLAEAGYPNGFSVRLDGPNDRYLEDSLVEQAIGGLLSQAGIKVSVNSVPKAVFFPQVDKGDFTMYFAGWGSNSAITTWGAMYHCRDEKAGFGVVNREHFCDPEADAQMQQAGSNFDADARAKQIAVAYHDADQVKYAYLPLYYEDVIAGVANSIDYTSREDEQIFAWQMKRK